MSDKWGPPDNRAPFESQVQLGDWVRFYRNGMLVVGVVEYIMPSASVADPPTICTELGALPENQIIEWRHKE